MEEGTMSFDAAAHMRKIRTRQGMQDYLDVKWRLMWLRSEHPDASVMTEVVRLDDAGAIFKATISYRTNVVVGRDGGIDYIEPSDDAMTVVMSHGSETAGDFGDFIEKAETKAIGRACAVAGFGTDAASDFDDGVPMDGAAAAKGEPDRKMDDHQREEVEQQHQRNTGPASRTSQPTPSTLPATRNHPQPDGQDRARANVEEKMTARGLPVLPTDTYEVIAETVNRALLNAGKDVEVQTDRNGKVTPGAILNALIALPSAVPTHG
jgi:hypothetical protein